jgi:hypothetical protein
MNAPPGGFYERDTTVEYNQAGDPVIRSRQQQPQYGQSSSSNDDGGWGAGRDSRAAAYGSDSDRGGYGTGYMGYDDNSSSSRDRTAGLSEKDQRRLKYEQEAREEWNRAQREAAARRAAAESAPASATKPRVRYHEVKYDTAPYRENQGGWGEERRQPAYAYAGGQQQQEQQEQERKEKKKGMPGWLEMLGSVYAGGPDL